jgi:hypothetical protein
MSWKVRMGASTNLWRSCPGEHAVELHFKMRFCREFCAHAFIRESMPYRSYAINRQLRLTNLCGSDFHVLLHLLMHLVVRFTKANLSQK